MCGRFTCSANECQKTYTPENRPVMIMVVRNCNTLLYAFFSTLMVCFMLILGGLHTAKGQDLLDTLRGFEAGRQPAVFEGYAPYIFKGDLYFNHDAHTVFRYVLEKQKLVPQDTIKSFLPVTVAGSTGNAMLFRTRHPVNEHSLYQWNGKRMKPFAPEFSRNFQIHSMSTSWFSGTQRGFAKKEKLYAAASSGRNIKGITSNDFRALHPFDANHYVFYTRKKGTAQSVWALEIATNNSRMLWPERAGTQQHFSFEAANGHIRMMAWETDGKVYAWVNSTPLWDEQVSFQEVPEEETNADSLQIEIFSGVFYRNEPQGELVSVDQETAALVAMKVDSNLVIQNKDEVLETESEDKGVKKFKNRLRRAEAERARKKVLNNWNTDYAFSEAQTGFEADEKPSTELFGGVFYRAAPGDSLHAVSQQTANALNLVLDSNQVIQNAPEVLKTNLETPEARQLKKHLRQFNRADLAVFDRWDKDYGFSQPAEQSDMESHTEIFEGVFYRTPAGDSLYAISRKAADAVNLQLDSNLVVKNAGQVLNIQSSNPEVVLLKNRLQEQQAEDTNFWDEDVSFAPAAEEQQEPADTSGAELFNGMFYRSKQDGTLHAIDAELAARLKMELDSNLHVKNKLQILSFLTFDLSPGEKAQLERLKKSLGAGLTETNKLPDQYLQIGIYRYFDEQFEFFVLKHLSRFHVKKYVRNELSYFYIPVASFEEGREKRKQIEAIYQQLDVDDNPFIRIVSNTKKAGQD